VPTFALVGEPPNSIPAAATTCAIGSFISRIAENFQIPGRYSITLVACAEIHFGMVSSNVLAVFTLTTVWKVLGRSIGMSPGFREFRVAA
jgi:hypothetical protein